MGRNMTGPQWSVTHQGAARDGGNVMLRPVRATPCLFLEFYEANETYKNQKGENW